MSARPRRIGSLVVLGLLLAARATYGQQRDARELEAKKACLGGHPERGIEVLAELYAETSDPTYIYNQGRCFEQNGRGSEAVTRFREYLRKATGIAAEERAQVQARIDALEAEAHPAPSSAVPPPAAEPPVPAPVLVAVPDEAAQAHARHLRIAAFSAAGVGAAAAVVGVVMGLRARSLSNEVTNDANRGMYSQSKFDSGERAQTYEVIGYSVGGAALVAAGILYGLSRSHDEPASTASAMAFSATPLSATIDGTGARAAWRIRF